MRRLLRAVHLEPEVFAHLEAAGAPAAPGPALRGCAFALPPPELRLGLRRCLARQLGAPPTLALRLATTWPREAQGAPGNPSEALERVRALLAAGSAAVAEAHPDWPEVIRVTAAPGVQRPVPRHPPVLVTARAGEAALRGAGCVRARDVFGAVPEAARLPPGIAVSVFAAARDAPADLAGSDFEKAVEGSPGAGPGIGGEEDTEVLDAVDRLVHVHHLHGPLGRPTEAIFVGNGVWVPPWGVRLSEGFAPALPLPQRHGTVVGSESSGSGLVEATLPWGLLPQSLPSIAAVQLLGPRPGERVLDLCAAPGGKAQYIAQLMDNCGTVVAVEPGAQRFNRMERFLAAAGARAVECVRADGTAWRSGSADRPFDRAIVDAPCSSSGLWPRLDWRRLARGGLAALAGRQLALLAAAAREVKPGGIVVYSVCSYLPQETEAVCRRALAELPLEPAPPRGHTAWPGAECDAMGFFAARFRRLPGAVMAPKQ